MVESVTSGIRAVDPAAMSTTPMSFYGGYPPATDPYQLQATTPTNPPYPYQYHLYHYQQQPSPPPPWPPFPPPWPPLPPQQQPSPLPPVYDFHNLDRCTIVLADSTVRSYFALPPDYNDIPPPPPGSFDPPPYYPQFYPQQSHSESLPTQDQQLMSSAAAVEIPPLLPPLPPLENFQSSPPLEASDLKLKMPLTSESEPVGSDSASLIAKTPEMKVVPPLMLVSKASPLSHESHHNNNEILCDDLELAERFYRMSVGDEFEGMRRGLVERDPDGFGAAFLGGHFDNSYGGLYESLRSNRSDESLSQSIEPDQPQSPNLEPQPQQESESIKEEEEVVEPTFDDYEKPQIEDDPNASDLNSPTPATTMLQFFIKTTGGNTLVMQAQSHHSVMSLHDRIEAITHILISEQRLIYRGRQLRPELSLSESSIQNDTSLQLVGRLRSTHHPQVWQLLEDLVTTSYRLCRREDVDEPLKFIQDFIGRYLGMALKEKTEGSGASHLQVFIPSSATLALFMLYNSPHEDSRFTQQELPACKPILKPKWVISAFMLVAIVFIPIGVATLFASRDVVEIVDRYETDCIPATSRSDKVKYIQTEANNKTCTRTLKNHRKYVKSRSDKQLKDPKSESVVDDCKPEGSNGGGPIVPCGLKAWSLFNDTYTFSRKSEPLSVNKKGIAWKSDREHKFGKNVYPKNFQNSSLIGGKTLNASIPLSEQEDLIVWMRTAALPTFRKLYRKIEVGLQPNDVINVELENNYNTYNFNGKKKLVLSTTSLSMKLLLIMGSPGSLMPLLDDVRDFKALLRPLRTAVANEVYQRDPICIASKQSEYLICWDAIELMSDILTNLLHRMAGCLAKVVEYLGVKEIADNDVILFGRSQYLAVLKELHGICKLYLAGEERFWTILDLASHFRLILRLLWNTVRASSILFAKLEDELVSKWTIL